MVGGGCLPFLVKGGIGKSAFGNIANPYFSMESNAPLGNAAEKFLPAGGIGVRGFPLQAQFDMKTDESEAYTNAIFSDRNAKKTYAFNLLS